jgi:hypothetical protein
MCESMLKIKDIMCKKVITAKEDITNSAGSGTIK